MPARTDEELFDLLLLGLTWAQQRSTDYLEGYSGFYILHSMRQLGLIDGEQFMSVAHRPSASFREYVSQHTCQIPQLGKSLPRSELYGPHNRGDKWLIAVFKSMAFYEGGVTMPRGYKLLAAISGQRRALFTVADQYAPALTSEVFLRQWRSSPHNPGRR